MAEMDSTYYDRLGDNHSELEVYDHYRYRRALGFLTGSSVLDVGCFGGQFLELIRDRYEIKGVDANPGRVQETNDRLGPGTAIHGNLDREGRLDFPDASFDTVVCMEVIEHLLEPDKVLAELARIAMKRVVISVPYRERIRHDLCVHCHQLTPRNGHRHTFDENTLPPLLPPTLVQKRVAVVGTLPAKVLLRLGLPGPVAGLADRLAARVYRRRASWMFAVLEKTPPSR